MCAISVYTVYTVAFSWHQPSVSTLKIWVWAARNFCSQLCTNFSQLFAQKFVTVSVHSCDSSVSNFYTGNEWHHRSVVALWQRLSVMTNSVIEKSCHRVMMGKISGAIYGFARSADRAAQFADRAAQFADPHIAQLICRSRNHR